MKHHPAALCLLLLTMALLKGCHVQDKPSLVVSQSVAVALDPEAHSLSGTTNFAFIRRNARTIRFKLTPRATDISVKGGRQNLPFTFADGQLSVLLSSLSSGTDNTISVSYRASFNDIPRNTVSSEDPTYGVTGIISPKGIFLGSDAGWYPEPESSPKDRSIAITVPRGFRAITEGERISEQSGADGTISVWNVTVPGEKLALSAGPYHVSERRIDGIEVATYLFTEDASLSERYLTAVIECLRYYQGLFGPYPYKKFVVVENFLPTGYGFPSYTLIGGSVLRLPFIVHTSLPHEIVHCWWGNGVRVDYSRGNWSEGLATYLGDYLMEERKSPEAGVEYRRRILADYATLVSPAAEFPLQEFSGRTDPASRAIGYGKGAMLFHMVRLEIGDKAFFQALRNLIQDKFYQDVSWNEFTRAFSSTSGRDLAPFFTVWLQRPGGPRLKIREVGTSREGTSWRVNGVVQQSVPTYGFPLSIRLENTRDPVTISIPVKGERTSFSITSAGKPRRLVLDPDADLFRIMSRDELPPSVNHVKGSRDLVVLRAETCRADNDTLKLLLESLGHKNAVIRREHEVEPETLKGHDLLLCGIPRHRQLIPHFGSQVSATPHSFKIGATEFGSSTDSLFAVGENPVDRGRVAALFSPLSGAAARESVSKITHYGNYGYLAFRLDTNQAKGSFPVQRGDTVVNFAGADDE